jgi:hypothetical protein
MPSGGVMTPESSITQTSIAEAPASTPATTAALTSSATPVATAAPATVAAAPATTPSISDWLSESTVISGYSNQAVGIGAVLVAGLASIFLIKKKKGA